MNHILFKSLSCILFVLGSTVLSAQVTIGSDKATVSGALLQLKQFETDDAQSNGQSTANKGLSMPCVLLQALNRDLVTSLGLTTGSLDKDTHVGINLYIMPVIFVPLLLQELMFGMVLSGNIKEEV